MTTRTPAETTCLAPSMFACDQAVVERPYSFVLTLAALTGSNRRNGIGRRGREKRCGQSHRREAI
jgi:hypothetical protein